MPQTGHVQEQFSVTSPVMGGVNGVAAPHLVGEQELQLASNLDFSLEWGAARVRRGSVAFGALSAATKVTIVARNYSNPIADSSPFYASDTKDIYRGTKTGTATVTLSAVWTRTDTATDGGLFTVYTSQAFIANGLSGVRDNGVNTWTWVLPKPDKPTVSVTTATAFQEFNGVYGPHIGTILGSSTTTDGFVFTTATITNTIFTLSVVQAVTTNTNWENPTTIVEPATGHIQPLNTTSATHTYTIGTFGADIVYFSVPYVQAIRTLRRRVYINNATNIISETNYWFAEEAADTALNANLATTGWKVKRGDYTFVGNDPNPSWTNVVGVQLDMEFDPTLNPAIFPRVAIFSKWECVGAEYNCLTATNVGVEYFQTYCQVGTVGTNSVIFAESTPSEASGTATLQDASVVLTFPAFTGTATTGITHRAIYRSGGFLQDAYQVGLIPIGTNTGTISATDYGMPDETVLLNGIVMKRNLWSTWPGVAAVSEPFKERIFIGTGNELFWTAPGAPTSVQEETDVTVSLIGDPIRALHVWDRLIIVNQNSVYEMDGDVWEGPQANWELRKSGSRRGTAAKKTCIKTPLGIILFDQAGISTYIPGHGIDEPLTWVHEKMGDIWRGAGAADPAAVKGSRLPAINQDAIAESCAAYYDHKIYLAVPTGTATLPNTVFVLDNAHHVCWYYKYSFNITSLTFDYISNRLLAGTDTGTIKQLEIGQTDDGSGIAWIARTRTWTTAMVDWIVENCLAEVVGPTKVEAIYNGSTTQTLGTLTNSTKAWGPVTALGTVQNDLSFQFSGTSTASQGVYNIAWDALPLPMKVAFYITDPAKLSGATQLDLARFYGLDVEIATNGTFTNTWIIDGTAVSTATYTNTNAFERFYIDFQSFPPGCRGYLIQQRWNSSVPMRVRKSYVDIERLGIKGLSRLNIINLMERGA